MLEITYGPMKSGKTESLIKKYLFKKDKKSLLILPKTKNKNYIKSRSLPYRLTNIKIIDELYEIKNYLDSKTIEDVILLKIDKIDDQPENLQYMYDKYFLLGEDNIINIFKIKESNIITKDNIKKITFIDDDENNYEIKYI